MAPNAVLQDKNPWGQQYSYLLKKEENTLRAIKRHFKVLEIRVMYDCVFNQLLHDPKSSVYKYFQSRDQPIEEMAKFCLRNGLKGGIKTKDLEIRISLFTIVF